MSDARQSIHASPGIGPPAAPPATNWRAKVRREATGWGASVVLHASVLTLLAFVTLSQPSDRPEATLMAVAAEIGDDIDAPPDPLGSDTPEVDVSTDTASLVVDAKVADLDTVSAYDEPDSPSAQPSIEELSEDGWLASNLDAVFSDTSIGHAYQGRGQTARRLLAAEYGGTSASEQAVDLGLAWLANHQRTDGSWNFDHQIGPCKSRCGNPGTLDKCTTGATGLAVLCFLGAGHTHKTGDYHRAVNAGLTYLVGRMKVTSNGGNLTEGGGRMYDHGICGIALCEAFGMTSDQRLYRPAQLVSQFTIYAQDPQGGGWRYAPHMPGDTSAVGWQLMALKSARASGIKVPKDVWTRASQFLDSMSKNDGATYGYDSPGAAAGTTSVGLLCRIYLGWARDHEPLVVGANSLADFGPSRDNMYFNYYATQVLHQLGGPRWQEWNRKMRQQLVETQSHEGHEQGSWFVAGGDDEGATAGGRLYITAMSILTLEVYYRYLPIYRQDFVDSH